MITFPRPLAARLLCAPASVPSDALTPICGELCDRRHDPPPRPLVAPAWRARKPSYEGLATVAHGEPCGPASLDSATAPLHPTFHRATTFLTHLTNTLSFLLSIKFMPFSYLLPMNFLSTVTK